VSDLEKDNGKTSRCAKGLNYEKTSRRPLDKDKGLTKQIQKKRLTPRVSRLLDCYKKEPLMVNKAINNRQHWNVLNNGMCHIIYGISESKKT